jgi:hypothetical protein
MTAQDPWAGSAAASEAERIRRDLRRLREAIVVAWGERGVMLSRDERHELQREIQETCDLLMQLTEGGD